MIAEGWWDIAMFLLFWGAIIGTAAALWWVAYNQVPRHLWQRALVYALAAAVSLFVVCNALYVLGDQMFCTGDESNYNDDPGCS